MSIVVSGSGAVSSAGLGVDATWASMLAARSAPVPVPDPDARMARPLLYVSARPDAGMDWSDPAGLTLVLLAAAAREALDAAGSPECDADPRRIGVVLGTAMGESGAHESRRAGVRDGAAGRAAVFSTAGELASAIGARGPALSISNACAASAYAVAAAARLLETDECDVVLACGAESYSRVALGCFNRMGAVDAQACRPFAAERGGTVFGEGAGVLVLERAADARARGVRPLASLLGRGLTCDANHPTAPDPEGLQARRALEVAVAHAGLTSADIDAVVPHGTGTAHNDLVESQVLRRVLGARADHIPLYSLKALVGHTGGAAGALAAVAAVEISRRREVPGNVDVGALDPACDVFLPIGASAPLQGGVVVVNAYAFGGNNASLLFGAAS